MPEAVRFTDLALT